MIINIDDDETKFLVSFSKVTIRHSKDEGSVLLTIETEKTHYLYYRYNSNFKASIAYDICKDLIEKSLMAGDSFLDLNYKKTLELTEQKLLEINNDPQQPIVKNKNIKMKF